MTLVANRCEVRFLFIANGRREIRRIGKSLLKRQTKRVATRTFWLEKFPFFKWLSEYNVECLTGDVIAGVTTALTVIPQGIGYAPLAGLPLQVRIIRFSAFYSPKYFYLFVQYGLYASIMPGFLYAVFGSISEVTIGPTAVNALISFNYAGASASRALTFAFFTGLIQISLAVFKMGMILLMRDY